MVEVVRRLPLNKCDRARSSSLDYIYNLRAIRSRSECLRNAVHFKCNDGYSLYFVDFFKILRRFKKIHVCAKVNPRKSKL